MVPSLDLAGDPREMLSQGGRARKRKDRGRLMLFSCCSGMLVLCTGRGQAGWWQGHHDRSCRMKWTRLEELLGCQVPLFLMAAWGPTWLMCLLSKDVGIGL